ncbi:putative WAK-related receptor-like protein kinase family protein precursor [Iris pallida]|uniref:WAK-related receptor-like protein kinase family protein n=1 Tax=Iris pallida TaxID=29817 RepID=A0AAX6FFK7_IRIPA|nr:putative WAK-related receptor-like protein kinase family protein precursor [Iris pallida]
MEKKPLLLFFLLVLLSLSSVSHSRPCPPCGSTPVPFPLSTSPTCGDPAYRVRCSSSSLFFDALNSSSYPITSISPSSNRLVISPAPFVSPSQCITSDFFRSQGIQLDPTLPFNVSSSNTIMLLNCTARLLLSPLNCSSNSLCHLYANSSSSNGDVGLSACRQLPICCTFVAGGSSTTYSVRASGVGCSAYRSFVNLDAARTPVSDWGRRAGVELQWATPREPLCTKQTDCEDSPANATCSPDAAASAGAAAVSRCFCNAGLRWDPFAGFCVQNLNACEAAGDCGRSNNAPLIAGVVSGVSASLLVGAAGFLLFRRQRRIREGRQRLAKEREEILNLNNSGGRTAKYFTGREIKRATSNFSRDTLLGAGGYGEVFKGLLEDGTLIAVKCAKLGNIKSTDQVLNEVRILTQVNHRNLVRLLGCCVDLDEPLMVYEFISNGTLYDHLHGSLRSPPLLTWRRRLAIAHQTAEALAYLHFAASPPIYHRDIKSSNILLDDKLNAKVSDFGLSRLAEPGLSHVSTCAQGTLGYLDPEYYRNYQLTDKSDVYSFGVVLLELLTSNKAIDFSRGTDDVNLAVYVQRKVDEERLMEVVDAALKEGATQVGLDTMKAIGFLAVACLEERRQNRPSMKEVLDEIAYVMTIEEAAAAAAAAPSVRAHVNN